MSTRKPKPRGTSAPTPTAKPKTPSNTRPAVIEHDKPHARVADVAAHFGVSVRTVFAWIADGCPKFKRGYTLRLKIADVEAWLSNEAETQEATSS